MFLHGLIYGTPETREVAAAGLGDIIALTSAAALKPFVIQITGPLIRVIADRFAWQVCCACPLPAFFFVFACVYALGSCARASHLPFSY